MKTILSPGDVVLAKQDFFLHDVVLTKRDFCVHEKEYMFYTSFLVEKGSTSLIVAVKRNKLDPDHMMTLCMLCSKMKKLGSTQIRTHDYIDKYFLVLTHTP